MILISAIMSLLIACSTQKQMSASSPVRYSEYCGPDEKHIYSSYQEVVTQSPDGRFIRRIFFPETKQLTHLMEFRDRKLKIREGRHQIWYDDGTPELLGQYSDNKHAGEWKYFSHEGYLLHVGPYDSTGKTGLWRQYTASGAVCGEYGFRDNRKDGISTEYDSLGNKVLELVYRQGEVVDTLVATGISPVSEQMSVFGKCGSVPDSVLRGTCSERALIEFLAMNIRYPARARENNVQGTAIVRFMINSDGTLSDIKVLRGLSEDIRQEVIRIISIMPPWEPGRHDGQPVKVAFTMPIKFRLE